MNDIVMELVKDEIKELSTQTDFQVRIKESIEKVAHLYESLGDKPLHITNKSYLQTYWLLKLTYLLEHYEKHFGSPLYFLSSKEIQRLKYIKKIT